jgi:hypothetical protein
MLPENENNNRKLNSFFSDEYHALKKYVRSKIVESADRDAEDIIQTKRQLFDIEEVLSTHPSIASWHVDTDDIDNVLRIELKEVLSEIELIEEAHKLGIACAVMEG